MSDLQALLALWTAGLAHNNLREPRVPTLSHTHSALAPNLHYIGWKGGKKCRPYRLFFWCCFYSAVAGGDILVFAGSARWPFDVVRKVKPGHRWGLPPSCDPGPFGPFPSDPVRPRLGLANSSGWE